MEKTNAPCSVIRCRLAQRDDVPAIIAIANWYALNGVANFSITPEPLQMWLDSWNAEHRKLPWYVALRPDQSQAPNLPAPTIPGTGPVVGFAKASPFKSRCAYAWTVEVTVYIDRAYHSMKIGATLYRNVLDTVRRLGYCTAMAGITMPNAASVALHKHFGFQQVALFERVGWKFGQWHDVSYWELDLRDPELRGQPPHDLKSMADIGLQV